MKPILLLFCSSIFVAVWGQYPQSEIYPVTNKKNCAFPFTYRNKPYTDCTTDGDNGVLPWCSMTNEYKGLITYCYDFRTTGPSIQCLANWTMPGGKVYTKCDYISKTSLYKQCKTAHPNITYVYCDKPYDNKDLPSMINRDTCAPAYKELSNDHTMCFGPSPYGTVVKFTDDEKQGLLDVHNKYRSAVGSRYMFKLYWDDELAKLAQAHANLCAFEHDLAVNRLSPQYNWKNGQNIAMSSETRSTPASIFNTMLLKEKERFHYGGPCSPDAGSCLHYTQAMLSNLTRVGCGQTHCVYPDHIERIVTCNYIQSQYEDTYQTPYVQSDTSAVDCPSKQDNGLCDCGDKICAYDKGEYLEPATCNCISPKGKRSVRSVDAGVEDFAEVQENSAVVGIKTANRPTHDKRSLKFLKFGQQN